MADPFRQSVAFGNFPVGNAQNQIPQQITFIGLASFAEHSHTQCVPYVPPYHLVGPSTGHELLESSQLSSVGFLQRQRSVSTGLGLSLEARKLESSGNSSRVALGLFEGEIAAELRQQEMEIDRFLKIQGKALRHTIVEKVQSENLKMLSSIQERVLRKLREKEAEMDKMKTKNAELEEKLTQLNMEAAKWQQHAKLTESTVMSLKYNIQQVYAQSRGVKERCGETEVADAASHCDGGANDIRVQDNKDLNEQMNCKVCRVNNVCMLLLPCRHLCVCKDCESKLSFCPICQSSKFSGMEIYI